MRPVVRYSLKQVVFINVVFVILVVGGAYSLFTTPVENMPNVDMGRVFINTLYFGAAADDVEKLVTQKIEDALDGIDNIEYIQSSSYRNFSQVVIKFIDDSDYRRLYDEIRFRVLNIKNELPVETEEPRFFYIDTYIWKPVIMVNLCADMSQRSLKLYAEELRSELGNVPNVREVQLIGEFDDEFHVLLDPVKLRRLGVTFYEVTEAIHGANVKIPTGKFRKQNSDYMLDAGRRLSSQQQILAVIVRRDGDGNFVRVQDVASQAIVHYRDPGFITSVNGLNSIRLQVTKEVQGNAVTIAEAIKQISRKFEKQHAAEGIKVVFNNDSTIEINDALNTLGGNLMLGMVLVMVVLWMTLGFRNALLTVIGIPFSFLCALTVIKFSGLSINTISLFSFVLVTGIMVDDAVIIIENVFRHIQMGKGKIDAIVDGTAEVMLPVISSAITTILAFVPMLIMTGATGDFFAVIPKTVTYALVASLIEALFILPIHILDWGPTRLPVQHAVDDTREPDYHLRGGMFAPFWKIYRWMVIKILDHKVISFGILTLVTVASLAVLVISVLGIYPLVKVKFFPGNYFRYHVTLENPVGTSMKKTDAMVRDLSRFISDMGPQVAQSAAGGAGYYEDEDYQRLSGSQYGQVVVTLPEEKGRVFPDNPSQDPIVHLDYMRDAIAAFVDQQYADLGWNPVIKIFEEGDGPPTGKKVNIRVTASSLEGALAGTDQLMQFMQRSPGLQDIIDLDDNRPSFHKTISFTADQKAASEYGISPSRVTAMVAWALNGRRVGEYRTVDEEIPLKVRIARLTDPNQLGDGIADPLSVLQVPMIEHSSAPIYLRDLVIVKTTAEPNVRSRYNAKPTITISANIREGSKLSPAGVQVLVRDFFDTRSEVMRGVSLSFGGEFETTSKSYTSLTFAFFVALMAIYLVLSSQFNDYLQPLIIIGSVPFALIGVVLGLFLTRTTFTVGSFMAIVGLTGLVVNDSLLLIDFMNVRRRQGLPMRQAILAACAVRMRPVLITTITTMLGLLPMAIGIPRRSIAWAPMATAFVAGLSSATLLTLLITPANYELAEKVKSKFRRMFGRKAHAPSEAESHGLDTTRHTSG